MVETREALKHQSDTFTKSLFTQEQMASPALRGFDSPNPMVRQFGQAPQGRQCKGCVHLFLQPGVAGRYFKCDLRGVTRGAATDHRVRWPACAKFEEG